MDSPPAIAGLDNGVPRSDTTDASRDLSTTAAFERVAVAVEACRSSRSCIQALDIERSLSTMSVSAPAAAPANARKPRNGRHAASDAEAHAAT